MNRHHYALFVRNCHLVLLLRQEPSELSLASELRPAEWRWEIPQVCDNRWHHYAVSVESMEVCSALLLLIIIIIITSQIPSLWRVFCCGVV